ncbi:MAG: 1-acyl-sn-glycerol-3-phosphate acyltransferase [Candidatus Pacebacteria bacterium]|nr:1-acyl-sn-glycerol-3-phosphate acyltransferase [Candidatus Paceibacterota bacterium]
MLTKSTVKKIDRTAGELARSWLRHWVVHPLLAARYKVVVHGMEEGLSIKEGAVVVSNHVSRLDAALLMDAAWPFARLRPTAWWSEYDHPFQKWAMVLFGTVRMGSPKELPEVERQRITKETKETLSKLLRAGWGVLLFCEGGIGDGTTVRIHPRLSGVHDLLAAHPDKPLLLVRIEGIGNSRPRGGWLRKQVHIHLTRVDAPCLAGGVEVFNQRLSDFYNQGTLPARITA